MSSQRDEERNGMDGLGGVRRERKNLEEEEDEHTKREHALQMRWETRDAGGGRLGTCAPEPFCRRKLSLSLMLDEWAKNKMDGWDGMG